MEIQVMSFYGLEKIATEVAGLTAKGVCIQGTACSVLIEDTVSSNQLALYETAEGYFQRLSALNTQFQTALPITVMALPSSFTAVVGTKSPQNVLLKNLAGKSLTIKDIQVTLSSNLPARSTCNLMVTFSPPANATDGKTYAAVVAISYSGASSSIEQVTFPVSGTAKVASTPAPPPQPAPTAPPVSLTPQQKNDIFKNGNIHFDAMTQDQLSKAEKSIQIARAQKDFALGAGGGGAAPVPVPVPQRLGARRQAVRRREAQHPPRLRHRRQRPIACNGPMD
jgi:hypothetical protein